MEFASQGHNLFITGQGGVGKSEVVKRIVQSLKARGKTVGVICSSGIACQVYDRGLASTVHSFYGLSTAESIVTDINELQHLCGKFWFITFTWKEVAYICFVFKQVLAVLQFLQQ